MDRIDRNDYVDRYQERLDRFAYSPQTLGWGENGRQDIRFSVLGELALRSPESSVLDVGCGFADFYQYLIEHGWQGRYLGVDIVPGLLDVARQRHPELDLRLIDITEESSDVQPHDFVIASGVFNAALRAGDNEAHIRRALRAMHALSLQAVAVDFMSSHVDFQKEGAWHTDPCWALNEARLLSRRAVLRLDYMPYEFAMTIFRDDSVAPHNVFEGYQRELAG